MRCEELEDVERLSVWVTPTESPGDLTGLEALRWENGLRQGGYWADKVLEAPITEFHSCC